MADHTEKSAQKQTSSSRPLAVPVYVKCAGYRCLAFRDEKGVWLDYHSGKPLEGPVEIVEYDGD